MNKRLAGLAIALAAMTFAQTLTLTPAPGALPDATAGVAYASVQFGVSSGTGFNFTLLTGTLPSGFSLTTAGVLGGTTSSPGNFVFSVGALSAATGQVIASGTYSLRVNPGTLAITSTFFPEGMVGTSYYGSASAQGGTPPYVWSLDSGPLPNGLSVDATYGTVSGIPTQSGSFPVTLRVRDAATPTAQTATVQVTIVIYGALTITSTTLPTATRGQAYSAQMQAMGGKPPYIWGRDAQGPPYAINPPGLVLAANGAVTGTPTVTGTFTFDVNVQDSLPLEQFRGSRIPGVRAAARQPSAATGTTASISVFDPVSILTTALPAGTAGTAYTSTTLTATGGEPGYRWAVSGGALPAGLTLTQAGQLSGTPTVPGNFPVQIQASDSRVGGARTATASFTIAIAAPPIEITSTSPLPAGTVGTAYSFPFAANPTSTSNSWTVVQGTLPAGLTLSTSGVLSGTPTTAGSSTFVVRVSSALGGQASGTFALQINPPQLVITTASLPAAVFGSPYSQPLAASGGTPGYTWSLVSGTLPPGLTLGSTGVIAGTPTALGGYTFTVRATDSAANGAAQHADRAFTIQVNGATLTITTGSPLPVATFGQPYSQQLGASGGVPPYTWALTAGALPTGVTLSPAGVLGGTPQALGSFTFTARVTDSATGENAQRADRQYVLEVRVPALSISTPAGLPTTEATTTFLVQFSASGGAPPYRWTVAGGALPTGTMLDPTGVLSGRPEAGRFVFTLRVTDQAGQTNTREFAIVITEPIVPLSIITPGVPEGFVGRVYAAVFDARGGSRPYSWSVTGLPPGLTANVEGSIIGTPSRPGTYTLAVSVTDSARSQANTTFTLVIKPGTIVVDPTGVPEGTVGTGYGAQFSASGGLAPYRFSISGDQPPGLQFTNGLLSGTPTEAGTFTFTVSVTDAADQKGERTYTVVIQPQRLQITTVTLPDGTANFAYGATLAAVGGVKPYAWSSGGGSLPAGVTLNATTGAIGGLPEAPGTFTFTAQVADNKGQRDTRTYTFTIRPELVISGTAPATGNVGTALSASFSASGGLPPYRWSSSGTLPPGVSFADGTLSGTPTSAGTFTFTAQVTDAAQATVSRALTIEIIGTLSITTESLPSGTAGVPYSATLAATGGRVPYRWSGSGLPAGLTLGSDGTISGTPTAGGSFTVAATVTDASQPAQTNSRPVTLQIGLPQVSAVVLGGLPEAPAPQQQARVTLSIGAPFPSQLNGSVTLTFEPDAVNNANDRAIAFSTGTRTATFTIAPGSTQASFSAPDLAIQTGTTAGTITLTTALTSGGAPVTCNCPLTRTIRIARGVPVITSVRVTRTAGGFSVIVTGFSTTREVSQGLFRFGGTNLQTTESTVALTGAMNSWFQGASSQDAGGNFVLTMPFTVQGDPAAVTSVTVTLTNSVGASQPASANF